MLLIVAYELICAVALYILGSFVKKISFVYYFSNWCDDINNMMMNYSDNNLDVY